MSAIQAAIASTYRVVSNRVAVYAATLTLFLARTNNVWLAHNDTLANLLRGEISTTYKKMFSSWKLNDEDLFGSNIDLGEKSIHVLVEIPTQPQSASIKKPLRYTGMSTEVSCRKFLDALARELSTLYDFDFYYEVPTIGDVFHAVDNDTWAFRLKKRKQLTDLKLPDYFTETEWKALKDLNNRTTLRIRI